MAQQDVIILREFATNDVFQLNTLAPGTYVKQIQPAGNSLLSSLFIKSMPAGATIKVNYFDTTTGTREIGERFELTGHDLLSGPLTLETRRIIITKIHNKAFCEVIITGAPVEFGVYATVISAFASDLDAALITDGQAFDPINSKAMPFACLDKSTDTLGFVTCKDGGLVVSTSAGLIKSIYNETLTAPSSTVDILTATVPSNKKYLIKSANCSTNHPGTLKVFLNGTKIASGRSRPGNPNVNIMLSDIEAASNDIIKLSYTAQSFPSAASDIEGFLIVSEI